MSRLTSLRSNYSVPVFLLSMLIMQSCSNSPELDADIIAATGGEPNPKIVPFSNYKQILELFNELNYTTEAWQAGIREVPRIYLSEITDRWSKVTTKEIDIPLKKKLFFRAIGPLALRSNELILQNRTRVEAIANNAGTTSSTEQVWLAELAVRYGLNTDDYANKAQ